MPKKPNRGVNAATVSTPDGRTRAEIEEQQRPRPQGKAQREEQRGGRGQGDSR